MLIVRCFTHHRYGTISVYCGKQQGMFPPWQRLFHPEGVPPGHSQHAVRGAGRSTPTTAEQRLSHRTALLGIHVHSNHRSAHEERR